MPVQAPQARTSIFHTVTFGPKSSFSSEEATAKATDQKLAAQLRLTVPPRCARHPHHLSTRQPPRGPSLPWLPGRHTRVSERFAECAPLQLLVTWRTNGGGALDPCRAGRHRERRKHWSCVPRTCRAARGRTLTSSDWWTFRLDY